MSITALRHSSCRVALATAITCVLAGSCGGSLGFRSKAEFKGTVTLPPGLTKVRLVVPTGTIGIVASTDATMHYAGGVRRAASSSAALAALEAVPLEFTAAADPADPAVLVVRAPSLPADQPESVFGLEVGVHLPAELPLELEVEHSGHVTLADRVGTTKVRTKRGDLRFERCRGDLHARTGTGNVIAFDQEGEVNLETGLGDMQVFVRKPARKITLMTGQGTVQCFVPRGAQFEVDAVASVGKVGNGFGLANEQNGYSGALRGQVGSADLRIVLRTGSGHLMLSPKDW